MNLALGSALLSVGADIRKRGAFEAILNGKEFNKLCVARGSPKPKTCTGRDQLFGATTVEGFQSR